MSSARVFGIESEYGLSFTGSGPGLTADAVARRLVGALEPLGHAHPAPSQQSRVDVWLTNGSRCYVDMGAHPEYATAESLTVLDVLAQVRAGDLIVEACRQHAVDVLRRQVAGDVAVQVFRNNLDRSGNTFGSHENYLVDRAVPFERLVDGVVGHLITRSVFTGAGRWDQGRLWLTQRAPHLQQVHGAETTTKRPLLNSRDEPHSDNHRWRRLHIISGDATMHDVATFLRVGTTHLVLGALEAGEDLTGVAPKDPLNLLARIDASPFGAADVAYETVQHGTVTVLDAQRRFLDAAAKHVALYGSSGEDDLILSMWAHTLDLLAARDWAALARGVDWASKAVLFDQVPARRRPVIDVFWHAIDPQVSLHAKMVAAGNVTTLVDDPVVRRAMWAAPAGRARVRASLVSQALERGWRPIPDWAQVSVDAGSQGWRYLPLPDPFDDTERDVNDPDLDTGGPVLLVHQRRSAHEGEVLILDMGMTHPWVHS